MVVASFCDWRKWERRVTGKQKVGMVATSVMLALTLSIPVQAQHPKHDQSSSQRQSAPRRESSHPSRQERSFGRQSSRPPKEYGGRMQSRPSYPRQTQPSYPPSSRRSYPQTRSQERPGGYPQSRPVARPPMSGAPNRAVSPYSQDRYAAPRRQVARPPSQIERRQNPSYANGQGREVPRPPTAAQNSGRYAQEQQRPVAHPPTEPMNRPPGEGAAYGQRPAQEVPRPPQANGFNREVPRPPTAGQRHGGDWLKSHRDLPLSDQQKALQSDPQFRRLPQQQQQRLVNRLQNFDNLPAQEQQRRLNRIETWEHLTPQQKQQARQLASQWQHVPQERRQAMKNAIGDLRAIPPQQREQVLNSDRYRGMFSEQERNMLRDTTKLPLAPAQPPAVPRPPQE